MPISEKAKAIIEKELIDALPEFKEISSQIPQLIQALEQDNVNKEHLYYKFNLLFYGINPLIKKIKDQKEAPPTRGEIQRFIINTVDQKISEAAKKATKSPAEFGWEKDRYFLGGEQRGLVESFLMGIIPDEFEAEKKDEIKDFCEKELPKILEAFTAEQKASHPYHHLSKIFAIPTSMTTIDKLGEIPLKGEARKYIILYLDQELRKTLKNANKSLLELGWDKAKLLAISFKDDNEPCTTTQLGARDWQWSEFVAPAAAPVAPPPPAPVLDPVHQQLLADNTNLLITTLSQSEEYVLVPDAIRNDLIEDATIVTRRAYEEKIIFSTLNPGQLANFGTFAVMFLLRAQIITMRQARDLPFEIRQALRALHPAITHKLAKQLMSQEYLWESFTIDQKLILLHPGIIDNFCDLKFYEIRPFLNALKALTSQQTQRLLRPEVKEYLTSIEHLSFAVHLTDEIINQNLIPRHWWLRYPNIIDGLLKFFSNQKTFNIKLFDNCQPIELAALNAHPCSLDLIISQQLPLRRFLNLTSASRAVLEDAANPRLLRLDGSTFALSRTLKNLKYIDRTEHKEPERLRKYCKAEDLRALEANPQRYQDTEQNAFLFNLLRYRFLTGAEIQAMSDAEFNAWGNLYRANEFQDGLDTYENLEFYPDRFKRNETREKNFEQLKLLVSNNLIYLGDLKLLVSEPNFNPFLLEDTKPADSKISYCAPTSSYEQTLRRNDLYFACDYVEKRNPFDPKDGWIALKEGDNPLLQNYRFFNACREMIARRLRNLMGDHTNPDSWPLLKTQCQKFGLNPVLENVRKDLYSNSEHYPREGNILVRAFDYTIIARRVKSWVANGLVQDILPWRCNLLLERMEEIILNLPAPSITSLRREEIQQGSKKQYIDEDLLPIWKELQKLKKTVPEEKMVDHKQEIFSEVVKKAKKLSSSSPWFRSKDIDEFLQQIVYLEPLAIKIPAVEAVKPQAISVSEPANPFRDPRLLQPSESPIIPDSKGEMPLVAASPIHQRPPGKSGDPGDYKQTPNSIELPTLHSGDPVNTHGNASTVETQQNNMNELLAKYSPEEIRYYELELR